MFTRKIHLHLREHDGMMLDEDPFTLYLVPSHTKVIFETPLGNL